MSKEKRQEFELRKKFCGVNRRVEIDFIEMVLVLLNRL